MENNIVLFRFEPSIGKYMVLDDGRFYAISKAKWPKVISDINNYRLVENKDFIKNFYSAPLKVQIQATAKCNLLCRTCAAHKGEKGPKELSLQELKSVIDKLADAGVLNLEWSGGEPFLRPDFLSIAEYALSKGLKQNVLTNGMFFTKKNIDRIKELFFNVQISIDDVGENYDQIVGKRAWRVFLRSLELGVAHGLNLQVASVLQKENCNSFENIIKFCNSYGLSSLRIAMEIPIGRSQNHDWGEYVKVISDFERQWPSLSLTAKEEKLDVSCFLNRNECLDKSIKNVNSLISPGGHSLLYIDAYGDIYPFPFLSQKEFYIGSILDNDLCHLWLNSNVLKDIRRLNNKKIGCDKCRLECAFSDRYLVYAYRRNIAGEAMPYRGCPKID